MKPALWASRTREIIRLREINPELSGAEIARRVGCTREWVRQVLDRAGVDTVLRVSRFRCTLCGGKCTGVNGLCRACWQKQHRIVLQCHHCGMTFALEAGEYRARHHQGSHNFYCSRECWAEERRLWVTKAK